jgi:hypothetical protein
VWLLEWARRAQSMAVSVLFPRSTKGETSFLLNYFEYLQVITLAVDGWVARFSGEGANVNRNLHRPIVGAACGSAALVIVLTVGCAAPRAPAAAVRPDSVRTAPVALAPASPEVLTQTAECALHALNTFEGDPFTAAYAGEVSRCGVAALNAAAARSVEIEPFVGAICSRAVACGEATDLECRESFSPVLVLNLERAIGAMNRGGREQLRACLRATSCEALQGRISTCLEPILDQLLWLPD